MPERWEPGDFRIKEAREHYDEWRLITPRVILMTPERRVMLLRYENTNWWGFTGGKETTSEQRALERRMSLYPTVSESEWDHDSAAIRESMEEAGIDLRPLWKNAELLATTTVTIVSPPPYPEKPIARVAQTPLYLCQIDEAQIPVRQDIALVDLFGPMPGPIFPDASMGLNCIRDLIRKDAHFRPDRVRRLNQRLELRPHGVVFQMGHPMGTLMVPPPWLKSST